MKVGIVGLGGFGKLHYNTIGSMRGIEVTAVCDKNKELLNDFDCKTFNDYEQMLKSDIDAVDIVVDETLHHEFAKRALEEGKDVFLEKPMALTGEEARDLEKTALEQNRVLLVGMILRFDARHALLYKRIREGKIGEIRHIYCRRNFTISGHNKYGRVNPFLTGAIHDIDLIIWMSGEKVKKGYAAMKSYYDRKHPDALTAHMELESGCTAMVENIWHLPENNPYGFEFQLEIIGSKETVKIGNQPDFDLWSIDNKSRHKELEIDVERNVENPEMFFSNNVHDSYGGALRKELEHFVNCCEQGRQSEIIKLDETRYGVEVANKLIESGKKGEIVFF